MRITTENRPRRVTIGSVIVSMLLAGCSTGEEVCQDKIDDYIEDLDKLPIDQPQVEELDQSACGSRRYRETRQFEEVNAAAFESEHIWPGALIHGETIATGQFAPILVDRGPMTFSVSLESLAGRKSATLEDPKISTFREAMGEILGAGVDGATPADIQSDIVEIESGSEVALELGGKLGWTGVFDISNSYRFERKDIRSRYLVKFYQRYYTVDVDPPKDPHDFLSRRVCTSDLSAELGPGNPPVYVSSMTYGRMVLFTLESTESSNLVREAIEATFHPGNDGTIGGKTSEEHKQTLDNADIKAYVWGGSGGLAAAGVTSYENMLQYISEGGNYSKNSPGAPLSLRLSYLSDATSTKYSVTEEYELNKCGSDTGTLEVTLESIVLNSGGAENSRQLYGKVEVRYGGQTFVLFDKDRDGNVEMFPGQSWPQSGSAGSVDLEVTDAAGTSITLAADLDDKDTGWFEDDDDLGDETKTVQLSDGWNRSESLELTGDGASITVNFSMRAK